MRHRRLVCVALAAATLAIASVAAAAVDPLVQVTVPGPSPFAPGCEGAPQSGTVYPGGEVEPWVDVNPANNDNIIGDWQQDRYSNGGARGNMNAFSMDGGDTWTTPPVILAPNQGQAKFSRCTGGNAANGGDLERATDPWVSFSPNRTA